MILIYLQNIYSKTIQSVATLFITIPVLLFSFIDNPDTELALSHTIVSNPVSFYRECKRGLLSFESAHHVNSHMQSRPFNIILFNRIIGIGRDACSHHFSNVCKVLVCVKLGTKALQTEK